MSTPRMVLVNNDFNSVKDSVMQVRKLLASIIEEEVQSTPEFKVTYISNKIPKIVKFRKMSSAS
jgi:hypothetical protein